MPCQYIRTHYSTHHTRMITFPAYSDCAGFFDNACYEFYLCRLFNCLRFYQVQLHGYALLPDRIWLLMTPKTVSGLKGLINAVNLEYSTYFNTRFSRTGCAWSKTCNEYAVTEDEAVLACQRFIEREPVRQKLSEQVGVWPWTSYCGNAFGGVSQNLTRHPAIAKLLCAERDTGKRYREFVAVDCDSGAYNFFPESGKVLKSIPDRCLAKPTFTAEQSHH